MCVCVYAREGVRLLVLRLGQFGDTDRTSLTSLRTFHCAWTPPVKETTGGEFRVYRASMRLLYYKVYRPSIRTL